MVHREGEWYGGNIPGKPKASNPEKVSNRRQSYREGAQPWANLTPAQSEAFRADLADVAENGRNVYAYDGRTENVVDTDLVGDVAVAASLGGTASVAYTSYGTYVDWEARSTGRKSRAPKVAAPKVIGAPKVKSSRAVVDQDRAAANRARQVQVFVDKLARMDADRRESWIKWNVPKAFRELVQAALIDA
ncbi:hypothetical protein SEA_BRUTONGASTER_170 [Gordonia phage BrutonGaster]|uniref:Uncharacterized protein n=1 Tax=Gordonia phage BrutonGaster TaxID=2530116 RepID=A0A482JNB2_9CAUD|nr:hypothetical protein HOV26_gp012 [Gordonia phage BrutonGaster]QBP33384.1 hypothetical protein SEA_BRUTONGASTER_170 [Gordonia phage BrutonGaster]